MSLKQKVIQAKKIIKKAGERWRHDGIAVAWTGGKDSTVILHLVREVFSNQVPFVVMFNDSTLEFPEIYDFVKKYEKDWELNLKWVKHLPEDLQAYQEAVEKTDLEKQMEVMRIAKINAINFSIAEYNLQAFVSGIRKDEHESRSQEKAFSQRSTHWRVHPILDFTIDDIWEYIHHYQVPYVNLYDQGYKSLGEKPFTKPVDNPDAPERAGREATKEKTMKRLRKLGYW